MTSIDRSVVSEYVNKLAVNNNISDKVKDKVIDSIANDGIISKEEVDDIQGLLNQERLEQNGGKCELNPEDPDAGNIQGNFVEFMGKITKQSTFTPQAVQFSLENGALAVKTKEEVQQETPKPEVPSVESVKPAKVDPKPTEVKPKTPYGIFTQKDFKYNTQEAKENNNTIKTLKSNPNIIVNKNSKTGVAYITTKGKEADSDVRKLQEMLKVKVDGKIGPQTLDAIVKNYTMLKITNRDTSELDTIVAKLGLGDLLKDKSISGKNFSEAIAPKKLEEIKTEESEIQIEIKYRPLIPFPTNPASKESNTTISTDSLSDEKINQIAEKACDIQFMSDDSNIVKGKISELLSPFKLSQSDYNKVATKTKEIYHNKQLNLACNAAFSGNFTMITIKNKENLPSFYNTLTERITKDNKEPFLIKLNKFIDSCQDEEIKKSASELKLSVLNKKV